MFSLMFKSGRNLDIEKILDQSSTKIVPRYSSPTSIKTKTRRISIPEPEAEDIMLTHSQGNIFSEQNLGKALDQDNQDNPFTNIIMFRDETQDSGGHFARGSLLPVATGSLTTPTPFTNVILESPSPPANNILLEDASLEDRVRRAMLSVLGEIPGMGDIFQDQPEPVATIKSIKSGHNPHEKIVHAVLEHGHHNQHHHELGGQIIERPHFSSRTILGGALHSPSPSPTREGTLGGPVVPEVPQPILHKAPSPASPPPPTVSIVELPAEPGCRSFSTNTCNKIPIVVPKKVPYDECRSVPSVECFFVLKEVDDLECAPVSYEDCDREAVEVPYLDTEEVCEDVEFEECVDAEVQVS